MQCKRIMHARDDHESSQLIQPTTKISDLQLKRLPEQIPTGDSMVKTSDKRITQARIQTITVPGMIDYGEFDAQEFRQTNSMLKTSDKHNTSYDRLWGIRCTRIQTNV